MGIASDVKLLIMPFNVELAQRLFAFSINGNELSKLDYDGVVSATGISQKVLSKDCWNRIVTELNLPQSEPFDASKQKIQESEEAKTNVSAPSISNILSNLISSDLRQLLINIGEPIIAEIVFSNSINGQSIYDYNSIDKFNAFADHASYESLLQKMETCYQKNGVVDIYNKESVKLSEESKQCVVDEKNDANEKNEYELLKQNVSNLIASDVKLLVMPYNVELAQRLFAFSINGNDLCKFDYDGVVSASGISQKVLSKDCWNRMVKELKLPQSEPSKK